MGPGAGVGGRGQELQGLSQAARRLAGSEWDVTGGRPARHSLHRKTGHPHSCPPGGLPQPVPHAWHLWGS